MTDVEIREWSFEPEHGPPKVLLLVGGKRAPIHFRTGENGGQRDKKAVEDGEFPIWEWDGDRDAPTLSPSIDIWGAHFHIKDGDVVPVE